MPKNNYGSDLVAASLGDKDAAGRVNREIARRRWEDRMDLHPRADDDANQMLIDEEREADGYGRRDFKEQRKDKNDG
jgi:hypothetical protein